MRPLRGARHPGPYGLKVGGQEGRKKSPNSVNPKGEKEVVCHTKGRRERI